MPRRMNPLTFRELCRIEGNQPDPPNAHRLDLFGSPVTGATFDDLPPDALRSVPADVMKRHRSSRGTSLER